MCETYCGESSRCFIARMYEHIASNKNNDKIITPVSKYYSTHELPAKDICCSVTQWLRNRNNPEMTVTAQKQKVIISGTFPLLHRSDSTSVYKMVSLIV